MKIETNAWEAVLMVLAYIATFGTLYLVRVLITHAIRCAFKKEDK